MIIKLWELNTDKENYKEIKRLINKYGKSNKQIAEEILEFVYNFAVTGYPKENTDKIVPKDIEFYGYYSDYDWVVFCWLFGYMKDLPKGFPMYCIDLKQELDRILTSYNKKTILATVHPTGLKILDFKPYLIESRHKEIDFSKLNLQQKIAAFKKYNLFPKQTVEHSSIHDARFNRDLYNFLKTL